MNDRIKAGELWQNAGRTLVLKAGRSKWTVIYSASPSYRQGQAIFFKLGVGAVLPSRKVLRDRGWRNLDELPTISPSDISVMLFCTVRYAMGRATYMPSLTQCLVRRYRSMLTSTEARQLRDEIARAVNEEVRVGRRLGTDADHDGWVKLVEDLGQEAA